MENQRLRASLTCKMCLRSRIQVLYLPCRHVVCCMECSEISDDCVICSTKILGTVRVYL